MPKGNQSGPRGQGPMTGRGLGYCAGANQPGFMSGEPWQGGGRFGWRGRGRGRRNMLYATGMTGWQRAGMANQAAVYPEPFQSDVSSPPHNDPQEVSELKQQVVALKEELNAMRDRVEELSKTEPKKDIG